MTIRSSKVLGLLAIAATLPGCVEVQTSFPKTVTPIDRYFAGGYVQDASSLMSETEIRLIEQTLSNVQRQDVLDAVILDRMRSCTIVHMTSTEEEMTVFCLNAPSTSLSTHSDAFAAGYPDTVKVLNQNGSDVMIAVGSHRHIYSNKPIRVNPSTEEALTKRFVKQISTELYAERRWEFLLN